MRARDVMTGRPVTVSPPTTVKRAAELMSSRGFTALPVVDDDGRLVGVVSEADVLRDRFPADARHPGPDGRPTPATTVAEVMTTPVAALGLGTDVAELARVMLTDRHRWIPIVDGARLAGVVTRRDLLRVLARSDTDIATDVRRHLELYGGRGRWTVTVTGGIADVVDAYEVSDDRHVARVLAEAVPGCVHASVR